MTADPDCTGAGGDHGGRVELDGAGLHRSPWIDANDLIARRENPYGVGADGDCEGNSIERNPCLELTRFGVESQYGAGSAGYPEGILTRCDSVLAVREDRVRPSQVHRRSDGARAWIDAGQGAVGSVADPDRVRGRRDVRRRRPNADCANTATRLRIDTRDRTVLRVRDPERVVTRRDADRPRAPTGTTATVRSVAGSMAATEFGTVATTGAGWPLRVDSRRVCRRRRAPRAPEPA